MGLDVFNRPAGKDNLRLKRTSLCRSTRLGYRLSRVHQLHNTAWMGWIRWKSNKRSFPTLPNVFTEQEVAMLATVLRSQTAVEISILIMGAFVAMRRFLLKFNYSTEESLLHSVLLHLLPRWMKIPLKVNILPFALMPFDFLFFLSRSLH